MNTRHHRFALGVVLAMALGAPLIAQTVAGIGTDGAIACSPSTITTHSGDDVVIQVRSAGGAPANLHWKSSGGNVVKRPDGSWLWDLTNADAGYHTAEVRAVDPAGRIGSCSIVVRVRGTRSGELISGRTLLARASQEEIGYGLYTYVLFGAQPNTAMRERYMAALDAYLNVIPDIEGFQQNLAPARRNVTFFPVDQPLSPDVRGDAAASRAWLLEHHDYARARQILQPIADARRDGPFLLSCAAPRSTQAVSTSPCLFQDLSTVPPRLVTLWMQEFINHAQMAQFSGTAFAPPFAVRVRTAIALLADNVPTVALDQLIRWTKN